MAVFLGISKTNNKTCDLCGKNPATIKLTKEEVTQNKRIKKAISLCPTCESALTCSLEDLLVWNSSSKIKIAE